MCRNCNNPQNEIQSHHWLETAQSTDVQCSVLQFHFNWYKIHSLHLDKVGSYLKMCACLCVRSFVCYVYFSHLWYDVCVLFNWIFHIRTAAPCFQPKKAPPWFGSLLDRKLIAKKNTVSSIRNQYIRFVGIVFR